ncbi:SLBB domain-containing protein [Kitasatospora arboriphila]
MKWQFIPQNDGKPHYLVVNADESEPGTCKDIPLLFANPHSLIEGMVIASYAIRCSHAFVYLRGEVVPVLRRLQAAVAEAYEAATSARTSSAPASTSTSPCTPAARLHLRRGDRPPRLPGGPPRPAPAPSAVPRDRGLYACPTVVNNVESIASVPPILSRGKEWFKGLGTEKSPGFTLYSLSGHVTNPGQYEAPLGITLRQLLEISGGIRATTASSSGPRAAPPPRCSPTSTSTSRSTTRASAPPLHARHQGPPGLRRDHLRGARRHPLDGVLRPRVLRQVHPLPRGHLLARPAAQADRG